MGQGGPWVLYVAALMVFGEIIERLEKSVKSDEKGRRGQIMIDKGQEVELGVEEVAERERRILIATLKRYGRERGITLTRQAAELGIAVESLSRMLSGDYSIKLDMLLRIAAGLGLRVALVKEKGSKGRRVRERKVKG